MSVFQVQSPDGRVFEVTAPDGASQADVLRQVQQQSQQQQPTQGPAGLASTMSKVNPTDDMSTADRLVAGVGSGMTRFARGAGNLAVSGLNKVLPSNPNLEDLVTGDQRAIKGGWFSDEALREQDQLDKPLSDTTAGSVGQAIGQTAASLPASMGIGAASNALRALPLVGRALANPLVRGGVEGGLFGGATADPDKQAQGMELGAGVGAGLTGILGAAGRLARGFIQKSGAAQDLENAAAQQGRDLFIPAAQAADPAGDLATQAGQAFYRNALPIVPGVSTQIKNQAARAMGTVRDMALDTATPPGVTRAAAQTPQQAVAALKDAFNDEYENTVGQYVYDVPKDLQSQVEDRIQAELPDVDDTTLSNVSSAIADQMDRFASGKATISGNNLLNAKNAVSGLMKTMSGPERAALTAGKGVFDDIINDELSTTVPGQADLARYQGLSDPYSALMDVSKAAKAAQSSGGDFTARQLAAKAKPGTPLADLAQNAQATLGQAPVGTLTPRIGRVGALLEAPFHLPALAAHLPAVAGTIAGGNALATQTAQRFMMGDTAAQKAIQALLAAHPESAVAVQTVLRNAATTSVGRNQ